jgi:hypothetical protein
MTTTQPAHHHRPTKQPKTAWTAIACWLLLTIPLVTFAQQHAPRFADYPSMIEAARRPLKPRLTSKETRRYATQLSEAATHPVNFAGRFILAEWGCGAGCVMAAAIDARSGKVVMLPFTVSDWPLDITEPLDYRKDSSLLVVRGSRNEQERGTYYYRFDGAAFTQLIPPPPTPPAPPDSDTTPAHRTSTARSPSTAAPY